MAGTKQLKHKIHVELTELDMETILKALGDAQNRYSETGRDSKTIRYTIDKLYRAMGVRIYS